MSLRAARLAAVLVPAIALLACFLAPAAQATPGDGPWPSSVLGVRNSENPAEVEVLVAFDGQLDPATIVPGQTVQLLDDENQQVPIAAAEFLNETSTLDIRVEEPVHGSLHLLLAGDSSGGAPVLADPNGEPLGANVSNPLGRDFSSGIAPTVVSLQVPPFGIYVLGAPLEFVATMSLPTFVDTSGGVPYLPLTLGNGLVVRAGYRGGSGTEQLAFTYTVAAGDTGGISLGSALSTGGGTLADGSGYPAGADLNGVGDTSGIRLDGNVPVAPASSTGPLAAPGPTASPAARIVAHSPACASRRRTVVHLRAPRGARLRAATLRLDGRLVTKVGPGVRSVPVSFVGLPRGTVTLTIRARTTRGVALAGLRRFHLCSARHLASREPMTLHRTRPHR